MFQYGTMIYQSIVVPKQETTQHQNIHTHIYKSITGSGSDTVYKVVESLTQTKKREVAKISRGVSRTVYHPRSIYLLLTSQLLA